MTDALEQLVANIDKGSYSLDRYPISSIFFNSVTNYKNILKLTRFSLNMDPSLFLNYLL